MTYTYTCDCCGRQFQSEESIEEVREKSKRIIPGYVEDPRNAHACPECAAAYLEWAQTRNYSN